jgi:glycosyltransferase involved in cell wall biosynthesis
MAAVALITVSESNATYIQNTFGVPRSHLRVIPCGVDTELFRPIAKKEEKNADPIVLCVARHVEVKNLALLLDAWALLRDRGIGFRCVMLGDGPLRCTLKAQCVRLCLEKVVEFPGAADQAVVLKAWQAATVGVLTSHNEGMPLSLMEAAACGVPVVATAVGGIPELVSDSITGLLVSPGNAIELSSALERLLTNHELRSGMGQAARELASRKFSVTRQIDSLLKVWSQVLGGAAYECHR